MNPLIERNMADGRSVESVVFGPLDTSRTSLEFVDIGARNGSFILPPSYAARARITGFEPNPVEYQKLVERRTDSMKAGAKEPAFKVRRYFPNGVWSEDAERTLYVTTGAGAVTLTGPADEDMTSNMFRANDRGVSYFDRHQRLLSTDRIRCVNLDAALNEPDALVDILKIDVEGGEVEVLKGARSLLSKHRILLIKSEFLLVPYYGQRAVLGHQHVLLDELGYRLISLESDQSLYSWKPTAIECGNDHGLQYAGDAIYVVDPDRNKLGPDVYYRLGLACLAMGFSAFGVNLLRSCGLIPEGDIAAVEREANRIPLMRRAMNAWLAAPDAAYRLLSSVGLKR